MSFSVNKSIYHDYKAIYHEIGNNHEHLDEIDDEEAIKAAKSVGCFMMEWNLEFDENEQMYRLSRHVQTLCRSIYDNFKQEKDVDSDDEVDFFPEVANANELVPAFGSGFLMDKKRVMTAWHVVAHKGEILSPEKLKKVYFVFDFIDKRKNPNKIKFSQKSVYKISKISCYSNNSSEYGKDWAIVELDRDVEDRNYLLLNYNKQVQLHDEVHLIGYPNGGSLKVVKSGRVVDSYVDEKQTFRLRTTSFAGNSGSPILDKEWKVVGILIAGQPDYKIVKFGPIKTIASFIANGVPEGPISFNSKKIKFNTINGRDVSEIGQRINTIKWV